MFELATSLKSGVEVITLKDGSSGNFAAVIPACGGILHSFNIFHDGAFMNVVDGYEDPNDFQENVTNKGFKGCKLSPFVCRLNNSQYHFGEKELVTKKFRLGKHAIHGLLYDASFSITGQGATETGAWVAMSYAYRGEDKGYPFSYDCEVTYHLAGGNSLNVSTTIINKDQGLVPMQDGWHPYFKFDAKIDDLQLEFQSKELVVFDEELLPTGELKRYEDFGSLKEIGALELDHCFTLNFAECQPLCVLRHPGKRIQLEIFPGNSYPYLQVYTPPHRNSIAIENLSGAPDAFNNAMGLIVMQPGEKKTFSTTYKITSLN